MKKKHGGARKGAGPKLKYGEKTEVVRHSVPISKVKAFKKYCADKLKKWETKKKK